MLASLRLPRDARIWQIAFQAILLSVGGLARDFSLAAAQMAFCFAAGIATQAIWIRALGLKNVGYLSAVITCFGLALLLRADSLWVHPLAAALALSAKFTLRLRGKHLFNPANLGVVLAVLLLPGAWISPGQWGSDLALAAWFIALGGFVASRAQRADTSWVFLVAYLCLIGLWTLWLGKSFASWLHHLQSGALLLFAFFMISDPMTTPDRRSARIVHAVCVAAFAFVWQFLLYQPNGLIWALFFCVPLVPLLDALLPGKRFRWREPAEAAATIARKDSWSAAR
ncbi:MAG: RnfABCDGE type electron transport complex subunit D [Burkholderiales bacterium]